MPRGRVSPTLETLTDRVYSDLVRKAKGELAPLHVGDTYKEPIVAARAESQRSAEHPRLHNYAPVQGIPSLLDAIVERERARTGISLDRACLQVMSGATSGLSVVLNALLDPGEEVLLPSPFWPLIRGIIASRGAVPVQIPFYDRLSDPAFDPERALEEAVTERTAALYLNTPNNPTGIVLPAPVVEAALRVAARHDLWIVCDEAYEDLYFTPTRPASIWAHEGARERAIVSHTLSKSFGLAGARVGYVHGPEEAMRGIRALQTYQTYCAPRPMQVAAVAALREGAAFTAECRVDYARSGRLAAARLGVAEPEGGTFLFFDASPYLRAGERTSLPFLERCLERGVLLTPGAACGEHYATWVRLCFSSLPTAALQEALDRIAPLLVEPS